MLMEERIQYILDDLAREGSIRNETIQAALDVSLSTIRRDLDYLERKGLLKRVHGGAVALSEDKMHLSEQTYDDNLTLNRPAKEAIAQLAGQIVQANTTIYLDAGTTTFALIPYLAGKNLTVVTNGLMHVYQLMARGIESYLLGGRIKATTSAVIGPLAIESVEHFVFQQAFLGVNGITIHHGYTTADLEEAYLKRAVLKRAQATYFLGDHTKINQTYRARITGLTQGRLITDVPASQLPSDLARMTQLIGGDRK